MVRHVVAGDGLVAISDRHAGPGLSWGSGCTGSRASNADAGLW